MKLQAKFSLGLFLLGMGSIFQAKTDRLYQQSQDVIIENAVVHKGLIDCQSCYDAMRPILDRYKRPMTVLDLGAGQGYFTFRIAADYKSSSCFMIEDNHGQFRLADDLLKLCRLNKNLKNIGLLNKKLSLDELNKLADCEHFDVVMAFDYINPTAKDWMQRVNAILRLGDTIFIRVPWAVNSLENEANKKVVEYFASRSGKLIFQMPSSSDTTNQEQLFLFECYKPGLRCKCFAWDSKEEHVDVFRITSTYANKTFSKKGRSGATQWKPGINLVTFIMLNGAYPTRSSIKQSVATLIHEKLADFAPWNLIVQGSDVVLIDQKDKGWRVDKHKSLNFINDVVDQTTQHGVEEQFKKYRGLRVRRRK